AALLPFLRPRLQVVWDSPLQPSPRSSVLLAVPVEHTGIRLMTTRFVIHEEPTAMVGTSIVFSDSLFEVCGVADVDHRTLRFLQHINVMHVFHGSRKGGAPLLPKLRG